LYCGIGFVIESEFEGEYNGLLLTDADYRVERMRYGKDKDRTTLIYNGRITAKGIPLEAYEYVVNDRPALDWVVERQCVKTDKDSGIVNDANDWAVETMNNPRYPLELFQRVVTVSLERMKIAKSLPRLDVLQSRPTVGQLMVEVKDALDALGLSGISCSRHKISPKESLCLANRKPSR
jgi:hypothetical protein